ncbi:MAG: tryptophan synthase beta chain [Parasphingorhabdus sp.]|jgi:tryptophan synthase beta chain
MASLATVSCASAGKALNTPARIYYKYEGVSPAGSHKPNTAVAQAFYCQQEGVKKIATETGAGQWGSSLAFAGALFGLEIEVFMVRISYDQKPYRRAFMETMGATCVASPSNITEIGKKILADDPDSTGSLGIAISEAVERAASRDDTKYSLGSVLNHVLLHQTVIGQEAMKQLELADDHADIIIGCAGGGSNFAGLAFPFIGDALRNGKEIEVIAAEPASCPTMTKGELTYDFGDTGNLTPLVRMYTLGSSFVPPGIHAGGLRYHGMAPMVSKVVELGLASPVAYKQNECFEAGVLFAQNEGIVPAPESTHAVKAMMDQAIKCREENVSRSIVFNLSGHGFFDMQAYADYNANLLQDHEHDSASIATALGKLPKVSLG